MYHVVKRYLAADDRSTGAYRTKLNTKKLNLNRHANYELLKVM